MHSSPSVRPPPLSPSYIQIFSSAPRSETPSICVLPLMREIKFHVRVKQAKWERILFVRFKLCFWRSVYEYPSIHRFHSDSFSVPLTWMEILQQSWCWYVFISLLGYDWILLQLSYIFRLSSHCWFHHVFPIILLFQQETNSREWSFTYNSVHRITVSNSCGTIAVTSCCTRSKRNSASQIERYKILTPFRGALPKWMFFFFVS
jgi:hypothetical protein